LILIFSYQNNTGIEFQYLLKSKVRTPKTIPTISIASIKIINIILDFNNLLFVILNVVHRLRLSLGSRLGSRGLLEP
jgi:hypothetical protein